MEPQDEASRSWLEREVAGCQFQDLRHGKRFRTLLGQLSEQIGGSIPFACQYWAATKAAYRFLSNDRISEEKILAGHFFCTRERVAAHAHPVLVLHDTTEFSYRREDPYAIGIIQKQQTRVPIEQKESYRWLENVKQSTALLAAPDRLVHIGDRESDIYELFSIAEDAGTHFLLRTCVDRLAGEGDHTVADEMREVNVQGLHRIEVRDKKGNISETVLELRYRRIRVLPPIAKQKLYPALMLTVLHATERDAPEGRDRIDWKLVTNLPVRSRKDAIEKLNWYAMRWKIETFHKILKSGFKAEELRLRSAERIVNLIAIFCILSWRVCWMTMLNRSLPEASPQMALTSTELYLLDQLVPHRPGQVPPNNTLSLYLTKLARLGGYLARAKDPPPGNTVMWRGLTRLSDIQLGFILGTQLVGN